MPQSSHVPVRSAHDLGDAVVYQHPTCESSCTSPLAQETLCVRQQTHGAPFSTRGPGDCVRKREPTHGDSRPFDDKGSVGVRQSTEQPYVGLRTEESDVAHSGSESIDGAAGVAAGMRLVGEPPLFRQSSDHAARLASAAVGSLGRTETHD